MEDNPSDESYLPQSDLPMKFVIQIGIGRRLYEVPGMSQVADSKSLTQIQDATVPIG